MILCLGSRGGFSIIPGSGGSIPKERAGSTSVPKSTAKIRIAVRGAGRSTIIATKMVKSSPMLQEKI